MMSGMGVVGKAERALTLEAAELTTCDPETSAVLCDTYLYEPESGEETLGSLFLVAETINLPVVSGTRLGPLPDSFGDQDAEPNTARNIIDTISATIREEYYRDPNRPMLSSFEAALEATNAALAAVAKRGDSTWLANLHAAVGVFRETTLHVSRVGAAEVLLARRGNLTDIGEGLSDTNVRHPHHAFTNIASGTITEHDVLVLANPQLLRLVPRDRLAAFLTGKSPRETTTYIRDLLTETADGASFAALFLRAARAPIALPAPRSLSSRETPAQGGGKWDGEVGQVSPESGDAGQIMRNAYPAYRTFPPPPAFARPGPPRFPHPFRRPPPPLRQSVPRRALSIARRSGVLLTHLVVRRITPKLANAAKVGVSEARAAAAKTAEAASNRLGRRSMRTTAHPTQPTSLRALTHGITTRAKGMPGRVRSALTRWPASTRIFVALTLAFALLFSGSIVMLKRKRTEEAAIRAASEKLEQARTKKQAADAALIYDNADEARQLLKAARGSATEVEATEYYDAEVAELLQQVRAVEDTSERITRISEPALVGDFGSVASSGRALGLQAIGPTLFAFSPETNAILRLTVERGETSVVSQTSQGIGYFKEAVPLAAEQMLLYATDTPGLALFDTVRGDLIKQDLQALPEGTKEIRALATFGSRLYLLLPEHRQIFGFSKTLAGYTSGSPWLKDESVQVARAISMGVDGYIYLLQDDGKIVKLLKGAPVEFAQSALATPLASPTKLLVNETLKHLYVLDPREKRVVVYDTTGKLTRQFVFENARDLQDIAIGGKEETLYVLDHTSVYKVPLK